LENQKSIAPDTLLPTAMTWQLQCAKDARKEDTPSNIAQRHSVNSVNESAMPKINVHNSNATNAMTLVILDNPVHTFTTARRANME